MKLCLKCNLMRPEELFGVDRSRHDNRAPYCRTCRNSFESKRRKEGARKYKKKKRPSKETVRNYMRKCRYGVTEEMFEAMMREQGGVCCICQMPSESVLHVDHCHKTGIVRGLLCGLCNRGIGALRDDPELVQRAADYLRKPCHKEITNKEKQKE